MDYLNIIATRSLELFAPARPALPHSNRSSFSEGSVTDEPLLIAPPRIAIPIINIGAFDTHLAYFLMQHILSAQPESTFANSNSLGTSPGSVDRSLRIEGEIMVWREIDKAKRFIRGLGEWFEKSGKDGKMPESELEALARACGLGIQKETASAAGDDRAAHHSHPALSHVSEQSTTSLPEVLA